jgi:hypothetical protein
VIDEKSKEILVHRQCNEDGLVTIKQLLGFDGDCRLKLAGYCQKANATSSLLSDIKPSKSFGSLCS